MILGDFEQALKIALTSPYTHDNKMAKKEKSQFDIIHKAALVLLLNRYMLPLMPFCLKVKIVMSYTLKVK